MTMDIHVCALKHHPPRHECSNDDEVCITMDIQTSQMQPPDEASGKVNGEASRQGQR
jgi:hypothetical protein